MKIFWKTLLVKKSYLLIPSYSTKNSKLDSLSYQNKLLLKGTDVVNTWDLILQVVNLPKYSSCYILSLGSIDSIVWFIYDHTINV